VHPIRHEMVEGSVALGKGWARVYWHGGVKSSKLGLAQARFQAGRGRLPSALTGEYADMRN
jgi:hypothetical protein